MEKEEKISLIELADRMYKLEQEVEAFTEFYKAHCTLAAGLKLLAKLDSLKFPKKDGIISGNVYDPDVELAKIGLPDETEFREIDKIIYDLNEPNYKE